MNTADDTPRRFAAASIRRGAVRAIGATMATPVPGPSADELDHQLGFDLGYRDGLAQATAEAETAAIEARLAWEASARQQQDAALAELRDARMACAAAADALASTHDQDRAWATALAVDIAFAAVVRLLGARAADRSLLGEYCEQLVATVGRDVTMLHVAPAMLEQVSAHVTRVPVLPDPSLERFDCRLEGPRGQIRAGVRARLDLLRDALLEALDDEGAA